MPRNKQYGPTPPCNEFTPSFGDPAKARKNMKLIAKEASPVGYPDPDQQPLETPSQQMRLRWSSSFWSISKPCLTDGDTVAYNRYQETSVCSSTPLLDGCTVRIVEDCKCALGIGIIADGRISTLWKYENNGTRFGYHTQRDGSQAEMLDGMHSPVAYGEPYGEGDLITVSIADGVLSFKKNDRELGPCFLLPEGIFYLRGYMCGRGFCPGRSGGGKLEIIAMCDVCATEGRLRCPCGSAAYCSKECQKRGWKTHKLNCSTKAGAQAQS